MSNDQLSDAFVRTAKKPTLGLVCERKYFKDVIEIMENPDAKAGIEFAQKLKKRFAVVAGDLASKTSGAIAGSANSHADLRFAIVYMNVRMGEIGSDQTLWTVMGSKQTQKVVHEVIAEQSGTEGAA